MSLSKSQIIAVYQVFKLRRLVYMSVFIERIFRGVWVCMGALAARTDENVLHASSRACKLNIRTSVHVMSEFFIEYVKGT